MSPLPLRKSSLFFDEPDSFPAQFVKRNDDFELYILLCVYTKIMCTHIFSFRLSNARHPLSLHRTLHPQTMPYKTNFFFFVFFLILCNNYYFLLFSRFIFFFFSLLFLIFSCWKGGGGKKSGDVLFCYVGRQSCIYRGREFSFSPFLHFSFFRFSFFHFHIFAFPISWINNLFPYDIFDPVIIDPPLCLGWHEVMQIFRSVMYFRVFHFIIV